MDLDKKVPFPTREEFDEVAESAKERPGQPTSVINPDGRLKGKDLRKRAKGKRTGKRARWYKMTSFFDGEAKSVMKIGDADVVLAGWVPPDNDCAICLVPTSITHEQGLALEKILEAQFRKPVLILTNNVQLVRLKPVSDAEANKMMGSSSDGEVVQVGRGSAESAEGLGLRADAGESDEGDLRPAGVAPGDEQGVGGEGSEAPPAAPEDERGPAE